MRTIDFGTVLLDAVNLCGFDLTNVQEGNFRPIRHFASNRLRMAWEAYPWATLTRLVAVEVTNDNGVRKIAIPADAGEVVGVYSENPNLTTQSIYLSFAITNDGTGDYIVIQNHITNAWLEYRIKREELYGELYNPAIPYAAGSQMYLDVGNDGEQSYMPAAGKPFKANFYKAKVNVSAGIKPVATNDPNWEIIPIPYIFGHYMSRGAYADFLRSEQMHDDAQRAEADAAAILELEYDKELRQQGQIRRINFINNY